MKCHHCERTLETRDRFCGSCGEAVLSKGGSVTSSAVRLHKATKVELETKKTHTLIGLGVLIVLTVVFLVLVVVGPTGELRFVTFVGFVLMLGGVVYEFWSLNRTDQALNALVEP